MLTLPTKVHSTNRQSIPHHILNPGCKYRTITDTVAIIKHNRSVMVMVQGPDCGPPLIHAYMVIIRTQRKGIHLNTLEKYHVHKNGKNNLQMNDTDIDTHNPIFRALQEMNTS
jgi:hypothetical protein